MSRTKPVPYWPPQLWYAVCISLYRGNMCGYRRFNVRGKTAVFILRMLGATSGVRRVEWFTPPPPPEIAKSCQRWAEFPSSVEYTSVTTYSTYVFHSFANWVEPLTWGYRPQISVLSALCPRLKFLHPPWKNFLRTPLWNTTENLVVLLDRRPEFANLYCEVVSDVMMLCVTPLGQQTRILFSYIAKVVIF
jgi:hypothetical protein